MLPPFRCVACKLRADDFTLRPGNIGKSRFPLTGRNAGNTLKPISETGFSQ